MASFRYLFSLSLLIALPVQGSTPTFVEAVCMPHKVLLELFRRKLKPQPQETQVATEADRALAVGELTAQPITIDPQSIEQRSDQVFSISSPYSAARAATARALRQARIS